MSNFTADEGYRAHEKLKSRDIYTTFDEIELSYNGTVGNPMSQSVTTRRGDHSVTTKAFWSSESCFLAIAKHRKLYKQNHD